MKRSMIKLALVSLVVSSGAIAMQQDQQQGQKGWLPIEVEQKQEKACADKVEACSSQSQSQDCSEQSGQSSEAPCQIGANVQQASCQMQCTADLSQVVPNACLKSLWFGKGKFGEKRSYANWGGATLENVYIRGNVKHVIAYGAKLNNVEINGTRKKKDEYKSWENVKLDGGTLDNVTFRNIELEDVDFKGASINNTLFDNVHFHRKHLRVSNFDRATLTNVVFKGSHLKAVTFHNAMLNNVSFECSDIECGAHFEGALIWNECTRRWDLLDANAIRHLRGHVGKVKGGLIDLSVWYRKFQTCAQL